MSSLGFALLRLFMGLRYGLSDDEFRAILYWPIADIRFCTAHVRFRR